jgi:hypothetical protein
MNTTCPMMSPFPTPCTCPFRIMFILSYPCNVFQAVSTEKKPIPGLTSRLMKRWSCSTMVLRYLTCRSSTLSGKTPIALSPVGRPKAVTKNRLAASASRVGLNRNSRVFPLESTARSRYLQVFLIFRYVSSTLQESLQALRCGRQRLSSSGAELWTRAVDGRMIDAESALSHQLFQVALAECRAQVPADAQENDLGFKVTPLEWTLLGHQGNSSTVLEYRRVYHTTSLFATQPPISTRLFISLLIYALYKKHNRSIEDFYK